MKSTTESPEAGRHAVGLPGHGKVAGFGLHHVVEAGPGGALVVAAVGREVHADETRVDRTEARIVESEGARQVAAQVVDQGVGAPGQLLQNLPAARLLEIQRQAALVAAEGLEEEAVAVFGVGQHVAAHLAAGFVFSILMISAPRSARYMVPKGAAPYCSMETTVSPSSGRIGAAGGAAAVSSLTPDFAR